ncbi:SDR family NAD(P)-dependent oxidoreductase [Arthrobacter glacialis]|uniref:SDR family NAD(P)-dependent oxidoreductase n=1 Tax=Arthrobacter glacialis TaxID=1664 RepID=UPI0010574460|nr:SDR family NAD(P)-dependent oxidoreductase [Arthrobacter glacialis]
MKKLAVVTGANRGLGCSLVQEFSESGWSVVAITRSPEVLKAGAGSADVTTVQPSRSAALVHRDWETLSLVVGGGNEEV